MSSRAQHPVTLLFDTTMSNIRNLLIDAINATSGTQSRAELNQPTVDAYADALQQGAEFPPVIVFSDGSAGGNWLADGFHRFHGHRKAGLVEILCEVRVGTLRDAKLFSFGANATHGLPRSSADKKRSVIEMLSDPEWSTWTQAQIAAACQVSREYVSRVSTSIKSSCDRSQDTVREVERNGKSYEMDTAKIGKSTAEQTGGASTPTAPTSTPIPAHAPADTVSRQVEVIDEESARDDDPVAQLLADYNQTKDERDQLQARVSDLEALVASNDLAAEVLKWKTNFEALSGRNRGLTIKLNELEPEALSQRETLKQVRQILGVERNADILPALRARRAA